MTPPLWLLIPFALLLLSLALGPLLAPQYWKSHRHQALVVLVIALPSFLWLVNAAPHDLQHALQEYGSFIALLGALYVAAGGVALTGDLAATPRINTTFLAVGAVLASVIGTTGASMMLIRPFLHTNAERDHTAHLTLFFIVIVSNCGGLLTPLGDPPLFLGYLHGVPFFWTLRLFPYWAITIGALLLMFYGWDRRAYARESARALARDAGAIIPLRLHGKISLCCLGGVVGSVFAPTPWRELFMVALATISWCAGSRAARRHNQFSWHPLQEIALLFAGIFITMTPALLLLTQYGTQRGVTTPGQFFWLTGALSSLLDNAPTYLTFFSLAHGTESSTKILEAISVGAVFFGANSYIGNGPNLMVKTIAEHRGFQTPTFFGYILRAALILFPIYAFIHWRFFW